MTKRTTTKKASARGTRKSLVEQYKAKARGKKTSNVSTKKEARPAKRSPNKSNRLVYEPTLTMEVNGEQYSAGDIAHFVLEGKMYSKTPHTGEIKECHPNDKTAPAVTVWDETDGKFRAIRACLVGWSKAEAKKRWQDFIKEHPEALDEY
jgi:hypothetical protein